MRYVPTSDFNEALCRLCGLDPEIVLYLNVRATPGQLPEIEVHMLARSEDGRAVITDGVIKEIHARYELVPKDVPA